METRKSIVKKVVHNTKQFSSANGQFFVHEVSFDNGDKGTYNSKSDTCTKFKEGQEMEYTIEPNGKYPAKIKPYSPPTGQGQKTFTRDPETQRLIARQTALKCACDLHSQSSVASDITKVLKDAEEMYNWIMA